MRYASTIVPSLANRTALLPPVNGVSLLEV
jgi:hypothetical protein